MCEDGAIRVFNGGVEREGEANDGDGRVFWFEDGEVNYEEYDQ